MAVSAATISGAQDTVFGNKRIRPRRLTFSSNYATGGEAITAANFRSEEDRAAVLPGRCRCGV
jgi:hypothetical protein